MKNNFLKYYTPFFCEENCWQLLNSFSEEDVKRFKVLFLSNPQKSIALMQQQLCPEDQYAVWDYHVIVCDEINQQIFDFDSRLTFPTSCTDYAKQTFGNQLLLPLEYQINIREVNAEIYLKNFHSDRSHMLDKEGKPIQKFPTWPAILNINLTLADILNVSIENKLMTEYVAAAAYFTGN